jgi:large subunit ribosomal protein L9e
MRTIYSTRTIDVPDSVTVSFKSREVTVKGPKGTLKRAFKHMSLDLQKVNDGKQIRVDLWFGNRETIAAIRWVKSKGLQLCLVIDG